MAIPVIYKGDDTDFRGRANLALKVTSSADLTGCKIEFSFLGQKRLFTGSSGTNTLSFVFTSSETATMPVGTHKAKIRVFDSAGRVQTVDEPRIKVTDDIREAYSGSDEQLICLSLGTIKDSLTATDVFDCTAGLTDLKERIAYLWEKCGGTVTNRTSLNYED